MPQRAKTVLHNLGIVALLFGAGIAAAFGFSVLGLESESSFLLFILGIFIASLETDSGLWGILLGVMYLLVYDLFFTVPHLALPILNQTDVIALAVFAVVALVTGTLTNRMKQQVEIAERNELVLRRLNKVSTGLIDSTSAEAACEFSAEALSSMLGRTVTISLGRPVENAAAIECFEQGYRTGAGVAGFSGERTLFLPLSAKSTVYGIVAIDCAAGEVDRSSSSLVDSVIKQTVIAIERNNLEERARADELRVERARLERVILHGVEESGEKIAPEELEELLDRIVADSATKRPDT